jgi:hypothetical protein
MRKRGMNKRRHFTASNRILSFDRAEEIRAAKAANDSLGIRQLAAMFGVNKNTIRGILNGTTYCQPTRHEVVERENAKTASLPKHSPNLTCRIERAKRADRLDPILAEAKRDYEALLAREKEGRKGGRPRGSGKTISVGRGRPNQFVNVHEDPRDALLNALGNFSGAA